MSKLTFAIIGCRHLHIQEFIEEMLDMGHRCVGIYEPANPKLREHIINKFGIPAIENLQDVWRERPVIVGCAAVNQEKIEIIEHCAERGIHVMVDKPIVTSEEGYERLVQVVKKEAIQVGMMLTERFQPSFLKLKEMIDSNELGTIIHISMRKPHRLSKSSREDWFFNKSLSGGIIIDLCIHDFDLLRWLTGKEMTYVEGYMSKNILFEYPDFYDTVSLNVLLNGELPVQLYADWHSPSASWTWGDGRVFVTGTKGCVELRLQGDPHISKESLLLYTSHDQPTEIVKGLDPSISLSQDFVSRINGEHGFITHEDILRTSKDTIVADQKASKIIVNTSIVEGRSPLCFGQKKS